MKRPRGLWLFIPLLVFTFVVALPSSFKLQMRIRAPPESDPPSGLENVSESHPIWNLLTTDGSVSAASLTKGRAANKLSATDLKSTSNPHVNNGERGGVGGSREVDNGGVRGGSQEQDVEQELLQEELENLEDELDVDIETHRKPLAVAQVPLPTGDSFAFTDIYMDPQTRVTNMPAATAAWNASRVFIISMTRDVARLQQLDAQLAGVGMQYTVVFAVDTTAKGFDFARYKDVLPEARRSEFRQDPLSTMELEQALTHVEIWSHMVNQDISYAVIMEEDVVLKPTFQSDFGRHLKQLNLLELQQAVGSTFDVCLLARAAWIFHGERPLTANLLAAKASMGTVLNLVSLQGAKRLLQHAVIDDPINEVMWQVHQLSWVAGEPVMAETQMYNGCPPGLPCRVMPTPSATPSRDLTPLKSAVGSWEAGARPGKCPSDWECVGFPLREEHREVERKRKPFRKAMPEKIAQWPVMMMNMERDTNRRDHMQGQLETHGFGPVVRAIAVDMSSTEIATFDHLIAKDRVSRTRAHWGWQERILSKGDVGCCLSHYRIWNEIVARRIEWAIVLEDDIDMVPDFREQFERGVAQMNELIAEGHELSNFDGVLIGREPITPAMYERPNLRPNIVVASMSWTTHSYIISLQGAKKLQRHFYVDDPIDSVWWRVPNIRFLAFSPGLTKQMRDAFGSTAGLGGQRGQAQPWRRRKALANVDDKEVAELWDEAMQEPSHDWARRLDPGLGYPCN